jgi:hypothetical protein
MSNKQERVEIYIQEDMDVSQRSWLVAKLGHKRGIICAWFEGGDHHSLTVDYERDHFSHITLLDAIKLQGFHGEIVGAR